MAGITLVNPVFVDTSEGKALVADSLKTDEPNQTGIVSKVKSKPEVKEVTEKSKPEKLKPEKSKPETIIQDESEEEKTTNSVADKRG